MGGGPFAWIKRTVRPLLYETKTGQMDYDEVIFSFGRRRSCRRKFCFYKGEEWKNSLVVDSMWAECVILAPKAPENTFHFFWTLFWVGKKCHSAAHAWIKWDHLAAPALAGVIVGGCGLPLTIEQGEPIIIIIITLAKGKESVKTLIRGERRKMCIKTQGIIFDTENLRYEKRRHGK